MGLRANDPRFPCAARPLEAAGHHSLVTSIDWKPGELGVGEVGPGGSPLAGDIY